MHRSTTSTDIIGPLDYYMKFLSSETTNKIQLAIMSVKGGYVPSYFQDYIAACLLSFYDKASGLFVCLLACLLFFLLIFVCW
jgi:hypothetical protein